MSKLFFVFFILATIGLLDAGYLTYEHFIHVIPPCSIHVFLADCGAVLSSKYATVLGIPVALFGALYYLCLLTSATTVSLSSNKVFKIALLTIATLGGFSSLGFILLQVFVLHAICVYCMTSDSISVVLLFVTWYMQKTKYFADTSTTSTATPEKD